jgi:inhibitor of KinA sporulation pathway (predicted exonuclease)
MKTKFDKINVVDIEATCWEGINAPRGKSEIIEIGIC